MLLGRMGKMPMPRGTPASAGHELLALFDGGGYQAYEHRLGV